MDMLTHIHMHLRAHMFQIKHAEERKKTVSMVTSISLPQVSMCMCILE